VRGHVFHPRVGIFSFQRLICGRIEDDEFTTKNPEFYDTYQYNVHKWEAPCLRDSFF